MSAAGTDESTIVFGPQDSTPTEFRRLTAARAEGFDLQIVALEHLLQWGVPCYPAVMASFSTPNNVEALRKRLEGLTPGFYDLEIEEVVCYPRVQEEIDRAGLVVREAVNRS